MGTRIDSDSTRYREQQQAIRDAEKDAQKKIDEAEQKAKDAEVEGDQLVNRIRDQYTAQSSTLKAENEAALNDQQMKAYEQTLKMKRAQEADIQRSRRQGEKQLADMTDQYHAQTSQTEQQGKKEVDRLNRTLAAQTQFETKNAQNALTLEHQTHQGQVDQLMDQHHIQFEQLEKQKKQEYDRLKENYTQAGKQSFEKYENDFQTAVKTQNQSLKQFNQMASQKLNEIREDTSQKLAAYGSRQDDPFYKLQDTKTRIDEKNDYYILRAKIPPHEVDSVNITVRGNEVVISGNRSNKEALEVAPGQVRKTSSYQSYSETFPIDWPVEPHGITRQYDGSVLTVMIPKKGVPGHEAHQPKSAFPTPTRAQAARPDFPANLPLYGKTDGKDDKSSS